MTSSFKGTTNPAGNKWVRNDRGSEDHPSPKKQKTLDNLNVKNGATSSSSGVNTGQAGVSSKERVVWDKSALTGRIHEVAKGLIMEGNPHQQVEDGDGSLQPIQETEEDSDDEGLGFGDFLTTGGPSTLEPFNSVISRNPSQCKYPHVNLPMSMNMAQTLSNAKNVLLNSSGSKQCLVPWEPLKTDS